MAISKQNGSPGVLPDDCPATFGCFPNNCRQAMVPVLTEDTTEKPADTPQLCGSCGKELWVSISTEPTVSEPQGYLVSTCFPCSEWALRAIFQTSCIIADRFQKDKPEAQDLRIKALQT